MVISIIHIPKCGGTSVTDFLTRYGDVRFDEKFPLGGRTFRPRHLHAAALEQVFFAGMFDYAFTVVRHPVSRILSEFTYQTRKASPRWQNLLGVDRWLRQSLHRAADNPEYRENHFRPQSDFLAFDCEVFRLEDGMSAVADKLISEVGLPADAAIPTLNKSQPAKTRQLTREQMTLIEKAYAADFANFGYEPIHQEGQTR